MNPIRPRRPASLRVLREALTKTREGVTPWTSKGRFGPLVCGHEQRESVNEPKCRGWGGEVVGEGRVGSVDEVSRETRRDQKGVHGRKARRTTVRESEHP